MRHASNNRRPRNRGGNPHQRRGGGGQPFNRNQVFDSNGPDVRIRGTAHQICEKYMALAKDATSAGDIILAESYMQHAEHYQRIINSWIQDQPAYNSQQIAADGAGDDSAEDDLGLPVSMLGSEIKVQEQQIDADELELQSA